MARLSRISRERVLLRTKERSSSFTSSIFDSSHKPVPFAVVLLLGVVCYLLWVQYTESSYSIVISQSLNFISEINEGSTKNTASQTATSASSMGNNAALYTGTIKNDLLLKDVHDPEKVWQDLIEEAVLAKDGGNTMNSIIGGKTTINIVEVGMHRAIQCVQAARAGIGFQAHCVEPSPTSFERVTAGVNRAPKEVQERIHLYNVAAGGSSQGSVPFTASGGTGDHVGGHNMWLMEKERSIPNAQSQIIQVPSKRLDDILSPLQDGVFLMKVDTQGYEPTVFSGVSESLAQHRIDFILMEFWPRGMDLLADAERGSCIGVDLLKLLINNGYTLFALGVQAHPAAPKKWKEFINERPFNDLKKFCDWYLSIEEQAPDESYKMGYWSDILAVNSELSLTKLSKRTNTGKALSESQR